MFVFVGAKHHGYRKVGYVADFCPLCRCPTVFEVLRIGVSRQTIKMYEEAGKKHLITHKRVCQDCGTEMAAQMTMYRTVAAAPAGLPTLMACTFPNLAAVHHARLALKERIRDSPGSLSTHQRLALVRESVGLLAPSVDRFYQPSFQGATWLIAGSIAVSTL
jgi:hypothetical protein